MHLFIHSFIHPLVHYFMIMAPFQNLAVEGCRVACRHAGLDHRRAWGGGGGWGWFVGISVSHVRMSLIMCFVFEQRLAELWTVARVACESLATAASNRRFCLQVE